MTINDEQRNKYADLLWAQVYEGDADDYPLHGRAPDTQDRYRAMAAAVADAARKDLYQELRAAAERDLRLTTSLNGGRNYILTDWLTAQEEAE